MWLEDQKIRLYKIEERVQLRDIKSSEWMKTFRKVFFISLHRIYHEKLIRTLHFIKQCEIFEFPQPDKIMSYILLGSECSINNYVYDYDESVMTLEMIYLLTHH